LFIYARVNSTSALRGGHMLDTRRERLVKLAVEFDSPAAPAPAPAAAATPPPPPPAAATPARRLRNEQNIANALIGMRAMREVGRKDDFDVYRRMAARAGATGLNRWDAKRSWLPAPAAPAPAPPPPPPAAAAPPAAAVQPISNSFGVVRPWMMNASTRAKYEKSPALQEAYAASQRPTTTAKVRTD